MVAKRRGRSVSAGQIELDLRGKDECNGDTQLEAARDAEPTAKEAALVAGQLSFDDIWDEESAEEHLRAEGQGTLGASGADPVRGNTEPGPLLRGAGGAGTDTGGLGGDEPGEEALGRPSVFGAGRAAERDPETGRGDRVERPGVDPTGIERGRSAGGVGGNSTVGGDAGGLGVQDAGQRNLRRTGANSGRGRGLAASGGILGRPGGAKEPVSIPRGEYGNSEAGDGSAVQPLATEPGRVIGPSFTPHSQEDLAPSGAKVRYEANVVAIRLAHQLPSENRPATVDEQQVLARFSSWGAVPSD